MGTLQIRVERPEILPMMNSKAPVLLASMLVIAISAQARQEEPKTTSTETKTVEKQIPFKTEYRFDRQLAAGRMKVAQPGVNGKLVTTILITKNLDGKEISRQVINTETIEPTKEIIGMGRQGHTTSRGSFTRASVRVMNSTAYTPSAGLKNPTFKTASGLPAKYGVIAVDRRQIKLGTLCFVEGYGFAIAADTGGAIKGNIIDVCLPTERECRQWGRRKVKVHIFNER